MTDIYIASSTRFSIYDRSASNPFTILFEELEHYGYKLTTDPSAKNLLCLNYSPEGYKQFISNGANSKISVLLSLEPEVVFPAQYKGKITSKFNAVLTPGLVNLDQEDRINWPYTYYENPLRPIRNCLTLREVIENKFNEEIFDLKHWEERSYRFTMVAANKVSNSRSSNYKLRRKIVKMYSQKEVAVFGQLWESSLKKRLGYRFEYIKWLWSFGVIPNLFEILQGVFINRTTGGEIDDKQNILANSKFNIVIENSNEVLTEKIFDALINGSIPIYFGPDISCLGISKDCYIVLDNIANIKELCDTLSRSEIEKYLYNIKTFVLSDFFQKTWGGEYVWKEIARRIDLVYRIST